MKKIFLYTIAAIGFFSCKKNTVEVYPKILVSGYIADTAASTVTNESYQKLNRVIFFALAPDTSGAFQLTAADSVSISFVKSKMSSSQQLFVSLGGPNVSPYMAKMAKDPVKRTNYINSVILFCKRWNLQGVDLDWEMVGTPPTAPTFPSATDYVTLSQQFSSALHAQGFLFTEAIGVYYTQFTTTVVPDNSYFNLANLTYNYVDQINVMAYGPYAIDPLYNQAGMQTFQNWLSILSSYGIPSSKVVAGIPFNGYHNALGAPADSTPNSIPYYSIMQKSNPAPTNNVYGNYGYNGTQTVGDKVAFLRRFGYAGVLASDISQDLPATDDRALLNAMTSANN